MSTTSPTAGRGGTIASAALGLLALLASLAVIVLTDDDLEVSGGASPGGGVLGGTGDGPGAVGGPGAGGGPSADDGGGAVEARPDGAGAAPAPSPSECTGTECPPVGPPTGAAGPFPYPPGTTTPQWTDDFCPDNLLPGTTVRQVRGSLTAIRDWYLTHLLDAGYGWGGTDGVRANPFNADNEALGWTALLTTSDPNVAGDLSLERADDAGQVVCGPARGVVFITVELP